MLARLAFGNIRKLMHDYAVYFLTLVLGVAVFYAFNTISVQADFITGDVSQMLRQLGALMRGITMFLAFVMGFLMVYANNFLMRRRKKEFGLYQVLGMRPGQVNAILTLETLMVALISFVVGLALGALFSQLLLFVTAAMFSVKIDHFRFFFSKDALAITASCFAVTFMTMMVFNTITLSRVKLVDLMSSARRNEKQRIKNVPLSLALACIGAALIGYAYWRLTVQGFPTFSTTSSANGTSQADFNITTFLVVVGTYVFFFGLAGAIAAISVHLKKHYWSGLHMFTTREIASRINTVAGWMATIALILFFAMTSVTTGMSICSVYNAAVDSGTRYSASIIVRSPGTALDKADFERALRESGVDVSKLGRIATVQIGYIDGGAASFDLFRSMSAYTGRQIPRGFEGVRACDAISISDYNRIRELQGLAPVQLADGRYLYLCNMDGAGASRGKDSLAGFVNEALAKGFPVEVAGTKLAPAQPEMIDDSSTLLMDSAMLLNPGTFVVPDKVAAALEPETSIADIDYAGSVQEGDALMQKAIDSYEEFGQRLHPDNPFCEIVTATGVKSQSVTITGLIAYLAIYIGFILVVASAAILAIQQLSAVSDSAMRYRTLFELGASERMIFGSLRTQAMIAFLLPLAVGLAHSICALGAIGHLLALFGQPDPWQSMMMGVALFVLVFGGYLVFTYRIARGVVKSALRTARHAL